MRLRIFLVLIGAILVAATYSYPLWRPLVVNTVVEEPFPGLPADRQTAFTQLPPDQQAAFLQMAQQDRDMAVAMAMAALEPPSNAPEDQSAPDTAAAVEVATGQFDRIDAVHWAQGKATIYSFPDNRKLLRLEDFQVANGPDLRVLLAASVAPRTPEEVQLST